MPTREALHMPEHLDSILTTRDLDELLTSPLFLETWGDHIDACMTCSQMLESAVPVVDHTDVAPAVIARLRATSAEDDDVARLPVGVARLPVGSVVSHVGHVRSRVVPSPANEPDDEPSTQSASGRTLRMPEGLDRESVAVVIEARRGGLSVVATEPRQLSDQSALADGRVRVAPRRRAARRHFLAAHERFNAARPVQTVGSEMHPTTAEHGGRPEFERVELGMPFPDVLVTLVVESLDRDLFDVAATLKEQDGRVPIRGAQVAIERGQRRWRRRAGKDGRVVIGPFPHGVLLLRLESSGFTTKVLRLDLREDEGVV